MPICCTKGPLRSAARWKYARNLETQWLCASITSKFLGSLLQKINSLRSL
ncbi:hypothetical protein ANCCAN_06748 [Ancylostoma caninum]|uniref:Uncharacterized protein n=1 Tax=Ancylostoma caninum TaxID=29170 RepID=A0A368GS19_ANCCA|nr:hypothetical protein ANCCAN_06748 [Ancylostoma caninum]